MSTNNLQNKEKSFLAWAAAHYNVPQSKIYSELGWTRQRYYTHIKQGSTFPRRQMALLAKILGESYSGLYKLEAAFYSSKQIYRTARKK